MRNNDFYISFASIILSQIASLAKDTFGKRLDSVILYGSYARGDYDNESDIDVMILVDANIEELFEYKKLFANLTSDLGLENDILITATLKDTETFYRYKLAVPFYKTVLEEGVKIAI